MNKREAQLILKVRDELAKGDVNEAFHNLYQIASPEFDKDSLEVWADIEGIANSDESTPSATQPAGKDVLYLIKAVKEVQDENEGVWQPCSGCHETVDGQETGHYFYSEIFKCYQGSGCRECGGIGVVWEDMSDFDAYVQAVENTGKDVEEMAKEAAKNVFKDRYGHTWEDAYNDQPYDVEMLEKNFLAGHAAAQNPPGIDIQEQADAKAKEYTKKQGTHDRPDITHHDYKMGFIDGASLRSVQSLPSDLVDKLREANNFWTLSGHNGWNACCDKLQEIINSQPSVSTAEPEFIFVPCDCYCHNKGGAGGILHAFQCCDNGMKKVLNPKYKPSSSTADAGVLEALRELVYLKSIKDIPEYKDEYERRNPLAWAAAKKAVAYYNSTK